MEINKSNEERVVLTISLFELRTLVDAAMLAHDILQTERNIIEQFRKLAGVIKIVYVMKYNDGPGYVASRGNSYHSVLDARDATKYEKYNDCPTFSFAFPVWIEI